MIGGVTRPVPLNYTWSLDPIHETIGNLVATHQAPVYVVHGTQAAAVERAQALLSQGVVDADRRATLAEELKGFGFAPGFGYLTGGADFQVPRRQTPRRDVGRCSVPASHWKRTAFSFR